MKSPIRFLFAGPDTVMGSDGIAAGLPAQVPGFHRQVKRYDA